MKSRLVSLLAVCLLAISSFLIAAPASADSYTVKMGADSGQLKFVPESLTVKPGDTVEWVMNKLAPHNVVFEAAAAKGLSHDQLSFNSGETFSVTIPKDLPAGTYSYFCQPHRGAGMVAKLVVE
ncbi:MAG: plastocyanin [Cyanobacteria bacterium P01_H01_bin.15]